MTAADFSAVERLAEEGDPERAFAVRLAPPKGRKALYALIAFNCELAKIPATVSEPMLGEIRLQWWAEALDDLFDKGVARPHEAMQALATTRDPAGWDRDLLMAMVEARRFSLMGLPTNPEERDRFLTDTGGAYHRLAVAALGGRSAEAQEVAGLVGWAEGARRLIAALEGEAAAAGLGEAAEAHLVDLSAAAEAKLKEARTRRSDVPFAARAPLMSVALAEPMGEGLTARFRLALRMARRRF